MPALTWLHLSDLHFRTEDLHAWDEDIVLRRLLDDVRQHAAEGLAPDLVFVTGDLAFSGAPAEYALARAFFDDLLAVTELPKNRLFPVPGNHDVDRKRIGVTARLLAPNLTTREAVSEVQGDATARREFLARFEGYAAFLNGYFDHLAFDNAGYFYVHRLEGLAGGCLAVLGLNSAWLAQGGDEDHGRLALGERQVHAALAKAEGASQRIALMHHPASWLGDWDAAGSLRLLAGECDFLLHGHRHEAGLALYQTPDARAWVLDAGASFDKRSSDNTYNLVRLDLEAGQGTVHLRAWSDRGGGFWTKDSLSYRNVPDGIYRLAFGGAEGGGQGSRDAATGRGAAADARATVRADRGSAAATGRGIATVGDGNITISGDVEGGVTIVQGGPPARGASAPVPGSMEAGGHDLAIVRDLLVAAFTAPELRRLFLYTGHTELRRLGEEFGSTDGMAAMADKTIQFCLTRDLLPDLLDEVKAANPRQYTRFASGLQRRT